MKTLYIVEVSIVKEKQKIFSDIIDVETNEFYFSSNELAKDCCNYFMNKKDVTIMACGITEIEIDQKYK